MILGGGITNDLVHAPEQNCNREDEDNEVEGI
jgi:hypothetical protein